MKISDERTAGHLAEALEHLSEAQDELAMALGRSVLSWHDGGAVIAPLSSLSEAILPIGHTLNSIRSALNTLLDES